MDNLLREIIELWDNITKATETTIRERYIYIARVEARLSLAPSNEKAAIQRDIRMLRKNITLRKERLEEFVNAKGDIIALVTKLNALMKITCDDSRYLDHCNAVFAELRE